MSGSWEIFFHFKGFSGADIYHSEVKMHSCEVKNFFLLVKNYFSKFPKIFYDQVLGRSKSFSFDLLKNMKNSNLVRQNNVKNA